MEENYILNEKLNTKNMRTLAKYLIEKEKKIDNIQVNINPITIIEWYKTDIFQNRLKLQSWSNKFNAIITPFDGTLGENYESSKKIYLFLNNFTILKLLSPKHILIEFILTTYHELAHSYQKQHLKKYTNLEIFSIAFLTNFIIEQSPTHYDIYHDQYFDEIDANFYAIKKTEEFLKNYPNIYLKHQQYIKQLRAKYEYKYLNYNFQLFFDKFHNIYKKNPEEFQSEHIITQVFYKENSSEFKPINEIIANENFNFFSKELTNSILSSKSFLEQLNFATLEANEKDILISALTYAYQLESDKLTRNILFQNNTTTLFDKGYLSYEKLIITQRIQYLETKIKYLTSTKETPSKHR